MGSLIPVVVIVKDAKPGKRARKRIASPQRVLAMTLGSSHWRRRHTAGNVLRREGPPINTTPTHSLQSVELGGVACARQTAEVIPVALLRLRDRAHCSEPSAPVPTSMLVARPEAPAQMAALGHEERFPPLRLSAAYGFRKETIAEVLHKGPRSAD